MALMLRYWGENKHGTVIGGNAATDDVADFVQTKFRAGWRSLTVSTTGAGVAREVGGIRREGPPPRRVWWAESAGATP